MTTRTPAAATTAAATAGVAAPCADAGVPPPQPPRAAPRPHAVRSPFGTRSDPYFWLRDDDRTDADVRSYLEAENAYRDAMLGHLGPLETRLFEEIVGRIKQDDSTVPVRRNGYWYYTRYESGAEYPLYARRKGALEAPEELLIDAGVAARGHDFYQVTGLEVSPDNRMLALTEDTVGRRQCTLRFRDLVSGDDYPDRIGNVEPDIAWANDNRTVLYVAKHPQTLLGYRVMKHVLGTPAAADELVYEQDDESFYTTVFRSKTDRLIYIAAQSTLATEYRYAQASDPDLAFRVALPRQRDHEYHLHDLGGRFIIRTNWQAQNFRVMAAAFEEIGERARWRDLVPHRADALVAGIDVFRNFLVVSERSGGLRRIRVRSWDGARDFLIDAAEPACTMAPGGNEEVDTDTLRYVYTSLTTPRTTYDYDMNTGMEVLLKRDPVLGGFDPAHYVTEFLWATARDGARVPVSLLYRRGTPRDGSAPLYQYAYGAYGLATDPSFRVSVLPLVDRGFVYAIAHVRGGEELGRSWYEDGRLLAKWHTFDDFVDVTRFLVRERYADPRRVFAMGGSAGGLLIGAVANVAPQDYRALVAHVPFVDVVTTMLDDSLPLTTNEYDEWGNPAASRELYDYILSYSPYDNVRAQAYPAMLVTTGLWDSQVQYFEPAKWVARLRALKADSNPLVFRTNMEAGHGGKSGRYQRYREIAEEYAFILDQAGMAG